MAPPPPAASRHRRRMGVAMLVSGVALAWFLTGVEWAELGQTLAAVDPRYIALAALMLVCEFGLRALRWQVLLRPLGAPTRVRDLFAAQVIGAAANTLLPFRAGEIAKPVVAARRTGHPLPAVIATAVMERVYDLMGLVSVLVVMALVLDDAPGASNADAELVYKLKLYGGILGGVAATCMAIFFALATRERAARHLFAAILKIAPKPVQGLFMGLFDGFVAGLGNARDPKGLIQAGLLSILTWMNGAFAIQLLFWAFGIDLPFGAACFTAVAIALAVVVPQLPGYLGSFHAAMTMTMLLWGQEPAVAQGFAIVFWGVSFVPVTLIGVLATWREGLDLRDLRQEAARLGAGLRSGATAEG